MKVPRYSERVPGASGSGQAIQPEPFDRGAKALIMTGEMLARNSRELASVALEIRESKKAVEMARGRAYTQKRLNSFLLDIEQRPQDHDKFEEEYASMMGELAEELPEIFSDPQALEQFTGAFMPLFEENGRFGVAQMALSKEREYTIAVADVAVTDAIVAMDMDSAMLALEPLRNILPAPEFEARVKKAQEGIIMNVERNRMDAIIMEGGVNAEYDLLPESKKALSQVQIDDIRGDFRTKRNMAISEQNLMYQQADEEVAVIFNSGRIPSNSIIDQMVTEGRMTASRAWQWKKAAESEHRSRAEVSYGGKYEEQLTKLPDPSTEKEYQEYFTDRIYEMFQEPDRSAAKIAADLFLEIEQAVGSKITPTMASHLKMLLSADKTAMTGELGAFKKGAQGAINGLLALAEETKAFTHAELSTRMVSLGAELKNTRTNEEVAQIVTAFAGEVKRAIDRGWIGWSHGKAIGKVTELEAAWNNILTGAKKIQSTQNITESGEVMGSGFGEK